MYLLEVHLLAKYLVAVLTKGYVTCWGVNCKDSGVTQVILSPFVKAYKKFYQCLEILLSFC